MNKTLTAGDEGYEEALAEVPFIKQGVPGFNRLKTYPDSVAEAEAINPTPEPPPPAEQPSESPPADPLPFVPDPEPPNYPPPVDSLTEPEQPSEPPAEPPSEPPGEGGDQGGNAVMALQNDSAAIGTETESPKRKKGTK